MVASGRDHPVHIYERDADLVESVARWVHDGLVHDDVILLIATPEHVAAVEREVASLGGDLTGFRERHVVLDVDAVRHDLVVDGHADANRFAELVGRVVTGAREQRRRVRAFGELVAVLWHEQQVAAALELETMWDAMARHADLAILCAYPSSVLADADVRDVHLMCRAHSSVTHVGTYDTGPYAAGPAGDTALLGGMHRRDDSVGARPGSSDGPDESDRSGGWGGSLVRRSPVYLPVSQSVPAARRWLRAVLAEADALECSDDAALVVSELATNAVVHATSPFRVLLDLSAGRLRVSVEDAEDQLFEPRAPQVDDVGGRGSLIIESLAEHWGCDQLTGGKVVWADLRSGAVLTPAH